MSPIGVVGSSFAVWVINGLLALTLMVVGFSVKREVLRADEHDVRIRTVEQACVKIDGLQRDITEMKTDVKTLLRKQ
jgi:hypothetical protein